MATLKTLDPPLPSKVIYQFPLYSWIENIAVRSNGQLLVTILSTPDLYVVDPENPEATTLVHKFDSVTCLTGIIEVEPDVFYVGGGNFSLTTFANEAGSYHLWEVNMKEYNANTKAGIKEIAHLSNAGGPNGFELLSRKDGIILIADSEKGCVWKANVKDGSYEIVVQVDEMACLPPPALHIGINGIKIRDGYLYWSNTSKEIICRIKIDKDAKPVGETEILEKDTLVDDFCFDGKGRMWLAQNVKNTVAAVAEVGKGAMIVAGTQNELTVAGGTACQFGRKETDSHVLYVVTGGGLAAPVGGDKIEGAKVVAIDTRGFE